MALRATTKISHTSRDFPSTCRAGALSSLRDLLPSRGSTKLSKVGEDVTESIQGHHLLAASEKLGIFHGRLNSLPACRSAGDNRRWWG
jgi:hypothetical protein